MILKIFAVLLLLMANTSSATPLCQQLQLQQNQISTKLAEVTTQSERNSLNQQLTVVKHNIAVECKAAAQSKKQPHVVEIVLADPSIKQNTANAIESNQSDLNAELLRIAMWLLLTMGAIAALYSFLNHSKSR